MTEEEIMALMAMLSEGGGGGDPYGEMYAPQGLPFIPQKTNARGQPDMNAAFNAMQDWIQMQSDPIMNAMLSAQTGVPLVDYNQQAPQEPIYTPTLDSLRSSTNEVLRGVAEGIEAGRSPFEIEAEMRAAGADPDTIDMATRAADAAFQEFGDFQRVSAENAQALSPLDEAYAEAGLPSPLARYGDPGYDHEDLPTEMRRQDQDVLGRLDAQLEALRKQGAGGVGRPAMWRQTPMSGRSADRDSSPEDQAQLASIAEFNEGREADRQTFDQIAGIERENPFLPQPGDPGYGTTRSADSGGITGSIAPGLGRERRAGGTAMWPGAERDQRIPTASLPTGDRMGAAFGTPLDFNAPMTRGPRTTQDEVIRTALEAVAGRPDDGWGALGTPLDFNTPSDRGPARQPSPSWSRSTPPTPRQERQPSRSAQNYANAVRGNERYSATSRSRVVQRNRDNLDRRYNDRLSTSRRVIADILAAQGRSPLNDAVNARQALLRQTFGI